MDQLRKDDPGLQKTIYEDQIARHLIEKIKAVKYILESGECDHNKTEALRALQADSLNYDLKG